MKRRSSALAFLLAATLFARGEKPLTAYVDPFLGTAALTNVADIGFTPPWRVWAGLTFPGASLPNAMVQLSPITKFGSGAGYEYEDPVIHGFAHSNKGHWNLCYVPILPVSGEVDPNDFASSFSHTNESAAPGCYQVFLGRYGINAELTTTLRCGFHKYTYQNGQDKKLIVNLGVSNERVSDWKINRAGDFAFQGFQAARETVYFYAVANQKIKSIQMLNGRDDNVPLVSFEGTNRCLEIKIGFSYVSTENAKQNLDAELGGKDFEQVKADASKTWEALLSKIKVAGGTERQKGLFYSCLYRSFLWPALRSDVNGEFTDKNGRVVKKNFRYYTVPSLWDDYRNKLVLLGMLAPDVAVDVIQSLIDRGECTGFMPTFFHGDHAAPFIAGSYLRGLRGFDVQSAYQLLLKNATVESPRARPFLAEYIQNGYVFTPVVENPTVETKAKAGVTKTLEYAYDDYAVGLLARELNDDKTYAVMMRRSHNYTNVFDPSTGLMRGRLANGDWVKPFNPQFPYYEYMYREANAWQSSFFAPQDTDGLIKLFPSKAAFEQQLDRLFSIPWNTNYIAMNINSFIGQYCQGNQPDHGFAYLYYWVGEQEKSQAILNEIMERFYGMDGGHTLCGMDDAGEMSSWYVFNAIGFYPYSPADPNYIVTVPLFDEVKMQLNGETLTITKKGSGTKITGITYDNRKVNGYFIPHRELVKGKRLVITIAPSDDSFTNPVAARGADPWVIQHDGNYYYCQSHRGSGLWVSKSDRLVDIGRSQPVNVWSPPKNKAWSKHLWAPELHYLRGKWFIYVAADDGDNASHRMYVLEGTSQDPQAPFVFRGQLATPANRWAIDGTVLQMPDERLYFIWSGWEGTNNVAQNLYIAPMSDPLTISGERVCISRPELDWEKHGNPLVNEGPEVLWHGDKLFIIYSASGSWGDDYCLGQLTWTGGNVLDPNSWVKKSTPVFAGTDKVISPGHASFVKSRDGTEDWIVYHTAKYPGSGWNRRVQIQKFGWNTDGSPDFGKPVAVGVKLPLPAGD